jgi:16S rRNA (uracil1498-N3)-methyltransferase
LKLKRFYCPQIPDKLAAADIPCPEHNQSLNIDKPITVSLDKAESHHLMHVMRLAPGHSVELFDGKGHSAKAIITQTSRSSATLELEKITTATTPPKQKIAIASSIAKAKLFDLTIIKCTELGIDLIVPVIFDHTVKTPTGKNALEKFKTAAVNAAKQSRRQYLPEITQTLDLQTAVEKIKQKLNNPLLLIGSPKQKAANINDLETDNKNICVFIGPEAGPTEKETQLLKNSGTIETKFAPNILRTETAAIAAAAILSAKRL